MTSLMEWLDCHCHCHYPVLRFIAVYTGTDNAVRKAHRTRETTQL